MVKAAAAIPGRHEFTAFADRRLAADESRIVVVETFEVAEVGDMILVRIAASHFLWKMVRKLVAALAEVGRGNMTAKEYAARLEPGAELFQPTAPPSGLFFEAVTYPGEVFDRPMTPLVPVVTSFPRRGAVITSAPLMKAPAPAARPQREPRHFPLPKPRRSK